MQFNTLNSIPPSLAQPVNNIPTFQSETLYYSYTHNSFISKPDLTPYVLSKYYGYGKVSIVPNWDTLPADNKEIDVDISLWNTLFGFPISAKTEKIEVGTMKIIDVPFKLFELDIKPFVTGPYGGATETIIRIDIMIERPSGLYEAL